MGNSSNVASGSVVGMDLGDRWSQICRIDWNSGETLREGLGKGRTSVVFWAGLSLLLTLAGMVIFSQLFFPTGTLP